MAARCASLVAALRGGGGGQLIRNHHPLLVATMRQLFPADNRCGCVNNNNNNNQPIRSESSFSRIPTQVYSPRLGELKAKQSLAKLLKPSKLVSSRQEQEQLVQLRAATEIFRSVMGEIYTSRNKLLIGVEGGRLVEDALNFGLKLKMLFLLKSLKQYPERVRKIVEDVEAMQQASALTSADKPEIYRIPLKALQEWSAVATPPGIIGVFVKPQDVCSVDNISSTTKPNLNPVPLTVVLDNVRDPGNLGSILRTAAGVGCTKVLLSEGCVDPWDMKSLRGGNGAQFLIPMSSQIRLETQTFLQQVPWSDFKLEAAPPQSAAEGSGIGLFLADSGVDMDKYGIPIVPYTSINYSQFKSIYLIMGGETMGLSDGARQTAAELQKLYPENFKCVSRITIPMQMPIDSLNVANAFGIIGYEIARQRTVE